MSNAELHYKPITEQAALLRAGDLSPVELTSAYLERIAALNDELGAYITVMGEQAMAQARQAESEMQAGEDKGALHGIPVGIKDIIYTRGVLTSGGSKVLADFVPDEDSTIVRRLDDAGAVLLGKLNLSEFAIGGTIDHPFGTPRNPWNTEHTAGGSSSGSGIAAAGGLCAGALGSDTGGSVRGPAGFCGIVGLRPTYGRVTRQGVLAMSWSLDTVGPMTRTVADCALMLNVIAGRDPRDPTSSDASVPDYTAGLNDGVSGLQIGLPNEMFDYEGLDADVRDSVLRAVSVLGEHGASSEEMALPMCENSGAVFIGVADVDCAAYHYEWLKTQPDNYDWSTRTRLETATLTPAWAYLRAQRARELIRRELMAALEKYDVIILPTGPVAAPPIEASTGKPGGYYQGKLDIGRRRYTSPAALAGLPALSIPCGFSDAGLPIGMQIIGRAFDEATLFRVGQAYESATEWHTRHPAV
ncbi:MAG: amidase [Chloroflexi bacterium]|nr:amidase [Chloroflexota bacterium]